MNERQISFKEVFLSQSKSVPNRMNCVIGGHADSLLDQTFAFNEFSDIVNHKSVICAYFRDTET